MTRAQSQALAAMLTAILWLAIYALHLAVGGAFALPPAVLAVLVPMTPAIDQIAAWITHGLTTGEWAFGIPLPTKAKPPVPAPPQTP